MMVAAEVSAAHTRRLVRRAWLVLVASFVVFAALLGAVTSTIVVFRQNAMQEREGTLATAGEVLLLPRNETRFKQVRDGEVLREGDTVKVQAGMAATLRFFDGSALSLTEGSEVVIDELKSSRFVRTESRIRIAQRHGWARIVSGRAGDIETAYLTVTTDQLTIESRSQSDQVTEYTLGFRELGSEADAPVRETRLAVFRGSTTIWDGSQTLPVAAGQTVLVDEQGALAGPRALPDELIRNGGFTTLKVLQGKVAPADWRYTADQGGDLGDQWGATTLTYQEINGQLRPVISLRRRVDAKDNAVHGIQQPLNLPLSEFRRLNLTVTFQILYHSLSGGGIKDSEYPIIVKLTYRDQQNRSIAWYRGFYTHNELKMPTDNGIPITQGTWYTFQQDILKLNPNKGDPQPVYLEEIDIYASGHDFDALVAGVSITGE